VRGAVPLGEEDRTRIAPTRAPRPARPPADVRSEAEALAELCDLVEGRSGFDIADSDEYIEGAASGLDRRIVHRLRKGEYAVQAHLDLHGLTKAEAKEAVSAFLTAERAAGHRCVLIIHGRGLRSKDQIPVLKERLTVWLSSGRLSRAVLAFATARPSDGGAGAVYVLLRRIHAARSP
jgi:DNA-nicking Smr family endonuclease